MMQQRIGFKIFALSIVILLFISSFTAYGQSRVDTASWPIWVDMMQDPEIPVPEVSRAFEKYWENRIITRGSGWKPFKRWEYYHTLRMSPEGKRFTKAELWQAYNQLQSRQLRNKSAGSWLILGPVQQPANIGTGQPNGMGRINVLAFHPVNPNHFYAGSASGGLWLTYDGGQTWQPLTDTLPTLGVSSLVVDPATPTIIYMGTGDRDHGDAPGIGVMRSMDGGFGWELKNNGMGNRTVGALLRHPSNPAVLLAATNAGIYRSTDSANSWTLSSQAANFKDMVFHPTNPNIVYASGGGNFYRSVDNGSTWAQVTSGLPGGNRGVIGVSVQSPDLVYFLLTNTQSFKGMYRSMDAGQSFALLSDSPNIMGYSPVGSDAGGQAWYNLAIAVDPLNYNNVYVGGVNVFKSIDGGVTWVINSHWYGSGGAPAVHADCHYLGYAPSGRLYAGNDGGVYYTDNGGANWTEISSGLAVSQIYKLGQSATVRDRVMTGYQDNGTAIYLGNGWLTVAGGDGMECAVDYSDASRTYGTYYYGQLFRLKNDSYLETIAANGSNGINESGAWVTPFIIHRTNPSTIFLGMSSIWRSVNVNAQNTSAVSWQNIAPATGSGNFLAIEQSAVDINLLYGSKYNNTLFRSDNVNDAVPVFQNITTSLPHSGLVKAITAHPSDPNTICIIQDRRVFRSINRGQTWTDITGSLPDVPLNTLIHYNRALNGLYVGTDLGVFYRDHHTADWVPFSHGLPYAAEITELEIWYDSITGNNDKIRASTYGRGMWESGLYETHPFAQFTAERTLIPKGCAINFTDLSGGIPAEWEWHFEGGVPLTSNQQHPKNIQYDSAGTYSVALYVRNVVGEDSLIKYAYIHVSDTLRPAVDFKADQVFICSGHDRVHFLDMSDHCPETWNWTFIPDSVMYLDGTNSTSANPVIRFLKTGTYDVILNVSNQNGSRSLTRQAYITNGGMGMPFREDFESGLISENGWTVENPNNNNTWQIFDLGSLGYAIGIAIYNTNTLGHIDRLITAPLDLSSMSTAFLNFRHAYAPYQVGFSDSLRVYISDDCGQTWVKLVSYGEDGSGNFATHPPTTSPFFPMSGNAWCWGEYGSTCKSLDISNWTGKRDIRIAFEAFSYLSNNMFLDDIEISTVGSITGDEIGSLSVTISPNPTVGIAWVQIRGHGRFEISLSDIQGRNISHHTMEVDGAGTFALDMGRMESGVYILTLRNQGFSSTLRVVRP